MAKIIKKLDMAGTWFVSFVIDDGSPRSTAGNCILTFDGYINVNSIWDEIVKSIQKGLKIPIDKSRIVILNITKLGVPIEIVDYKQNP